MVDDAGPKGTAAEWNPAEAAPTQSKGPPPAAQRALAEAAERRRSALSSQPREIDGRGGLEPIRFGDWEVKGIATDF